MVKEAQEPGRKRGRRMTGILDPVQINFNLNLEAESPPKSPVEEILFEGEHNEGVQACSEADNTISSTFQTSKSDSYSLNLIPCRRKEKKSLEEKEEEILMGGPDRMFLTSRRGDKVKGKLMKKKAINGGLINPRRRGSKRRVKPDQYVGRDNSSCKVCTLI